MPLSDDQKAMLRLLAREQSYEDIAALLGLRVEEVVSRARGAVAELESEGIPAPSLPDAPAGTAPSPPPAPKAAEPAPIAAQPPAPEPKAAPAVKPAPPAPPASPPSQPSAPKQPRDKGMLIAIGGGLAAVVVIVVLAVLLISNSDGDDPGSASAGEGTTVANEAAGGEREPTRAELVAVDGSEASGEATFGRVEETLGLGIEAENLEPAPKGSIYMVWLAQSPQKLLPLTAIVANKNGVINASYQVPTEAVVYLASGEFEDLVITRARNRALRTSLEQANQAKDFPAYTGDRVLEGRVEGPIIGAAKRLEERQQEGG